MPRNRDPFTLALDTLRHRVASGAFHPERPVVIRDEALRLGLSTTPIREALARLSGEGLVQRAASGGYVGARLDAAGVQERYRFQLQCLRLALAAAAGLPPHLHPEPPASAEDAPVLFETLIERSGDRVLSDAFDRVRQQLAMLSGSEARLLADFRQEVLGLAALLSDGDAAGLLKALAAYHQRRIELAVPLLLDLQSHSADAGARPA